MRSFLVQGGFIFFLFHSLNALLLVLHASAVPRRDLIASILGFVGLVMAVVQRAPEKVTLDRTKQFHQLFQILSLCEVTITILLPWYFVARDAWKTSEVGLIAGHLLAPHLFVFQEQIALEAIIMMQSTKRPLLMYQYTCFANAYRGIAIVTWILRTLSLAKEQESISPFLMALPAIASFIWVFSNIFIVFVWYPCLKYPEETRKKHS